jgi:ribonuclease Y
MNPLIMGALAGLLTAAIVSFIAYFLFQRRQKSLDHSKSQEIENAKQQIARELETERKDLLLQTKDEALRLRQEVEQEAREQRAELQRLERRLAQKEEALDKQSAILEVREESLREKDRSLDEERASLAARLDQCREDLQTVARLSREQAQARLMKEIEAEARHEATHLIHQIEEEARNEGERRARAIVTTAIQRLAVDHVSETTVSVVPLPSDDIKGRIIGREGRNIRTFETLTGVDVIIDDTPEAVVLSSFDPVRRETARIALTNLIIDGRIHPTRIEEMVVKAQEEVEASIRKAGEEAVLTTGVTGLHPELVKLIGRMRYRLSYGQNLLDHSIEVSQIGATLASEVGANLNVVRRACLLHDVGKVAPGVEGPHALVSRDLMLRYGESEVAAHAAGAHHNELEHERVEDVLVQMADAISAARPGARREPLESYVRRLQKLETLADSFAGVEKTYAVQAGREVRLIVKPETVDDAAAIRLARELAQRIEEEIEFPGQIKVTVIRETRAIDYAK